MAEPRFDRESVDRAFAEMVAGYHLTADRPDPLPAVERPVPEQPAAAPEAQAEPGPTSWRVEPGWAENHPLFAPAAAVEPVDEGSPRYEPQPLPPLGRPALPVLLGWTGVVFAALVVLAAGFGVNLPEWLGWLAVGGFICGFTVLLTQLPRHRPPDAGDGAVL
jgi:hypothetical protein